MVSYDVEHFNTTTYKWTWDARFRTLEEAVEWAKKVYVNTSWRVINVVAEG